MAPDPPPASHNNHTIANHGLGRIEEKSKQTPGWTLAEFGAVTILLFTSSVFGVVHIPVAGIAASDHLIGVLACGAVLGSLGYAAVIGRRLLLPDWHGPLARLAEAMAVVTVLLVLAQALGAIGWFGRIPLVIAAGLVGSAALLVGKYRPTASRPEHDPYPRASEGRLLSVLAPGVVVATLSIYSVEVLSALRSGGIMEYDSLWYHLPIAADFVLERSLTGITDVGNPPSSYYPFNGEAVHAVALALLGHDAFSPASNLVWLSVVLLAGWSIGLPFGRPRLVLIGVSVVAIAPLLVSSQGGTANVDLMGLALVLAAAAFIVNARGVFGPLILAWLAIGILIGTKLPMVPTAVALAVMALIAVPPGQRIRWGRWGLLCLLVGGSFWYVRNAIHTGNPVPWIGLELGILTIPSLNVDPADCTLTPVIHWFGKPSALAQHIVPQLNQSLGYLWPGLLAASWIGALAGVTLSRDPAVRLIGAVAIFGWIAYLITPASGGAHVGGAGDPTCFGYNLRFALPSMSLGIVAALLTAPSRLATVSTSAAALLFAGTMGGWDRPRWLIVPVALGVAAGLIALWWKWHDRSDTLRRYYSRSRLAPLVLGLAAGAVAVSLPLTSYYLGERYRDNEFYDSPLHDVARWARDAEEARIGLGGNITLTYPLYGVRVTNSVSYVGAPGASDALLRPESCDEWRGAITEGEFDYIVTTPYATHEPPPVEAEWTHTDPRAIEILSTGPLTVFSLDADEEPEPCDH